MMRVTAEPMRNIGGFLTGATYPLRAATFFVRHPSLWPFYVMPLLVNALVLYWVWMWSDVIISEWFAEHLLERGWFWATVRWLATALGFVLQVVMALAAFVVMGSLASLPFNDLLSERTDVIASGWRDPRPFSIARKLAELFLTLTQESRRLSIFALISMALFLLSWFPILTPFTTIGQLLLASSFFAMDYLSFPLERRGIMVLRDKKVFIQQNDMVCLGFGAAMTVIALIPIVNCLFLPLGVIGGTLLHTALTKSGPDRPVATALEASA